MRGTYGVTYGVPFPSVLVDRQRVYFVSGSVIAASERIEHTDLPENFNVSAELWTYEPDEDLSEGRMRRVGSSGQYSASQMVVRKVILGEQTLCLEEMEQGMDSFTARNLQGLARLVRGGLSPSSH